MSAILNHFKILADFSFRIGAFLKKKNVFHDFFFQFLSNTQADNQIIDIYFNPGRDFIFKLVLLSI